MLALFDQSLVKWPEGLKNPSSDSGLFSSLKDDSFHQYYASLRPESTTVKLGASGFMAYSSDKQNPLLPRLFAVVDDMFCLFQGQIENVATLKQQYGLAKTSDEVCIIIEAYRSLRDRGPYPADHVVRGFSGKFAFVLCDITSKCIFAATDAYGSVPMFWGVSHEHLVICDDEEIVKKACGKSYAPFPEGCFFTSSGGLRSFENSLRELKPVPWTNSSGQVCGATFKIDEGSKKETGMHRVGSAANWSSEM